MLDLAFRGLRLPRLGRGRGFNPARLAPSVAGRLAVYDPLRLSSLFQLSDGTTPVTALGQPVGRASDTSGNALHAVQASADLRPLYARVPQGGRRNMLQDTIVRNWALVAGGTGVNPTVNVIGAASVAVLPDGAAGAAAGKGWTCTGLAVDGETLWWGNIGLELEGGTLQDRQLVQTNLDGSAILSVVTINNQPQGVAVLGDFLYYANPSSGQVRRIPKAGGAETVAASVANVNGLAVEATGMWASSGTIVHRLTLDGAPISSFNSGVDVDHLHYDAARNWLWISSGGNGSAGFLTIWSLSEGRALNTYRLTEAQAVEGIALAGGNLIVSHDGYYHGVDIANAARRFNEIQTYPTAIITGGIWDGGLADYVFFNKGAGATSADLSQIQRNTFVGGSRVASLRMWTLTGAGNIAVSVADSGGNVQEVKSLTTTPTAFSTARAAFTGPNESFQLRIRGGVTAQDQLGVFIAAPQVEAGATPSAYQIVNSGSDITEPGKAPRFALLNDLSNDALAVTLPAATYTVATASDAGVTMTAGVVHGGGAYTLPGPQRLYGAVIIDRALTTRETAQVTGWLNERRL
ncbi:hypothetical protein [Nostoc phage Nsp-JY21]